MKNGYYWFSSERASNRSVAQVINNVWYVIGESQPMALVDIEMRGWDLGEYIEGQDEV